MITGRLVGARDAVDRTWIHAARTDAHGRYEATLLRVSGRYELLVRSGGGSMPQARSVDVVCGEVAVLDVHLPAGRLSGRLRRDDTGEPVAGVLLSVDAERGGLVARTRTDAHGGFVVGHLPPGTYHLRLLVGNSGGKAGAYRPVEAGPWTLAEGDAVDGIELSACRGASVVGHVTTPSGAGLCDRTRITFTRLERGRSVSSTTYVRVTRPGAPNRLEARVTSEAAETLTADGAYAVHALDPGAYRVRVDGGERGTAEQHLVLSEHDHVELDFVLDD